MDRKNFRSQMLHKLLNTDNKILANRYLKLKSRKPEELNKSLENVLNLRAENGNFKYGAITLLCIGDKNENLTFIYEYIFKKFDAVIPKNYELNIENIVNDLNEIFNDHAIEVIEMQDITDKVVPLVRNVATAFLNDILKDKVLPVALDNKYTY